MRAIILPQTTDANRGDQALLWESIRLVRDLQLFSDVVATHPRDCAPEEVAQSVRAGVTFARGSLLSHRRRDDGTSAGVGEQLDHSLRALLNLGVSARETTMARLGLRAALSEFDAVFIKGGGFLHSFEALRGAATLQHLLHHVRTLARAGKPVVVLPNSFGPITGRTSRLIVRQALSDARLVCAREERSQQFASTLLGREVALHPDLGLFFGLEDKIASEFRTNMVAITVRPWRFSEHSNPVHAREQYLSSIEALVLHVRTQGLEPKLIPHTLGPGPTEDDRIACHEIARRLGELDLIQEVSGDARDLRRFYGSCRFVVGTRFHSVVFAITSGTPTLAIGYGGNKSHILDSLGLGRYRLDAGALTPASIRAAFDELVSNEADVARRLDELVEALGTQRHLLLDDVGNSLG